MHANVKFYEKDNKLHEIYILVWLGGGLSMQTPLVKIHIPPILMKLK